MNIHVEVYVDRERRTDDHQGELNTLLDLVASTSSSKRHGELYEKKTKEKKAVRECAVASCDAV